MCMHIDGRNHEVGGQGILPTGYSQQPSSAEFPLIQLF